MRVIKSKGGYFYKEYKNGKKKRISKTEYIKVNLKGGSKPPLNKKPNQGTLNRILVTTYIEEYLEPKLREIITQSYFFFFGNFFKKLTLLK